MIRRSNPPNPWTAGNEVEWIGEPPRVELEVYEESARSILSRNDSPDLSFRWGLNPYRGCWHACSYCYARPTHEYLGFGAGTDFDRRIVAKVDAPVRLREAFERPSWQGEPILFSGVTDCYQPIEASYRLTRACLEVCAEYRNPVRIITKSALIRRDLDLLELLRDRASVHVYLSIPTHDDDTARRLEPGAASATARFRTLRHLAAAGIECGVAASPVIPGLTDADIPQVLRRARAAGASRAFMTLLRLPGSTRAVFFERLARDFPERSNKVVRALHDVRGGRLDEARFGRRMHGDGPRWRAISQSFEIHARRLGLETVPGGGRAPVADTEQTFRRPGRQLALFGRS